MPSLPPNKPSPASTESGALAPTYRWLKPGSPVESLLWPCVKGYRSITPEGWQVDAEYGDESDLTLSGTLVEGATRRAALTIGITPYSGEDLPKLSRENVEFELHRHLTLCPWQKEAGWKPRGEHHSALLRCLSRWIDECLTMDIGRSLPELLYREIADMVCDRVFKGVVKWWDENTRAELVLDSQQPVRAIQLGMSDSLDPKATISDAFGGPATRSDQLLSSLQAVDSDPNILACSSGRDLELAIPYSSRRKDRIYRPECLFVLTKPRRNNEELFLMVESRSPDDFEAVEKTVLKKWLPAVNQHGAFGRWDYLRLDPRGSKGANSHPSIASQLLAGIYRRTRTTSASSYNF